MGLGELQALPAGDAAALQQLATRLQRHGPLVQQQVVTGRVQLAELTQEQQQQLAWQLHKGAPEEAVAVMDAVLAQAAAASQQAVERVAGAAAGVQAVGLGLQLERATSAVSTAAPPSPALLAGELHARLDFCWQAACQ
jgi:phage-related tail fiber protein